MATLSVQLPKKLTPEIEAKYTVENNTFIQDAKISYMRDEGGRFVKGCRPIFTQGMKGKKHSVETKRKMSVNNGRYWLGKKFPKEVLEKLSRARTGKTSWNKGKKVSEEVRKKISEAGRGRKFSEEHRRKISEAQKGQKGNNWQGGVTAENFKLRNGVEFRLWREAVFVRDNFTCQICGDRSREGHRVELNADHIKPFSQYSDLRFALENGRTLCVYCHKNTDTYGRKLTNYASN